MTAYTFDQIITFTRTSAATYVGSNGLVAVTPASRNLLTYTQEFDNAAWTKTNATVTANAVAAPDGTLTGDTLVETAATGGHVVNSSGTVTTAVHVFSVYFKKGAGATAPNWVQLYTGGVSAQYANFNLGTGAVGSVAAGSTGTITAVGNGWYRCTLSFTPSSGGVVTAAIAFTNNTDTTTRGLSYAGAVTSDVFIWGAQLEAASAASTYTRNVGGVYPPRFDYDPVTLAPRGLLIEEQRTNLMLRSEEFDNAAWSKGTGATVTANATTSPDGTADADKLVETATTGIHSAAQAATTTASTAYTFSIYLKSAERSTCRLYMGNSGGTEAVMVDVDTTAGTLTTVSNAGTNWTNRATTISNAGNGWWRVTLSATNASLTSVTGLVYMANPAGTIAYTGDGTSGIYLWGAQLEAGAFATSYIPTVASQVTRTADVATVTGANFSRWYNQAEGSLVVEGAAYAFPAASSNNAIAALSDGTTANSHYVYAFGSAGYAATQVSSVVQANPTSGSALSVNTPYKMAYGYKTNDFAFTVNGATVGTDTSGTVPTVNQLQIGRVGSTILLNGHIRRIKYYPTRLSNTQLQALTA